MPGIMGEGSDEGSVPRCGALLKSRFERRGALGQHQFVAAFRIGP
jgi:hypothetical protein